MALRPRAAPTRLLKTDWCSVFLFAVATCSIAAPAQPMLERDEVMALARQNAPQARVAGARVDEVRAGRVGAGAPAQTNPELAGSIGPRMLANGTASVDATLSLAWPLDVSGAPRARQAWAEARVTTAEAERDEVERQAVREALSSWTTARVAEERVRLEAQRAVLDAETLRIARLRREAGAVGDGDVALATLLDAEARSRLVAARAEQGAAWVLLRRRLGLGVESPRRLPPLTSTEDELPPLDSALASIERHPALRRALAGSKAEEANVDLQRRLGAPVPRAVLMGERSPEYTARVGAEIALPLYQRNQTELAVAEARTRTALVEEAATRELLEAELRGAYVRFEGARAALAVLEEASPAIETTERLAARAYELGQASLGQLVGARREAALARMALLDARAALTQARIVVDLATGAVP